MTKRDDLPKDTMAHQPLTTERGWLARLANLIWKGLQSVAMSDYDQMVKHIRAGREEYRRDPDMRRIMDGYAIKYYRDALFTDEQIIAAQPELEEELNKLNRESYMYRKEHGITDD